MDRSGRVRGGDAARTQRPRFDFKRHPEDRVEWLYLMHRKKYKEMFLRCPAHMHVERAVLTGLVRKMVEHERASHTAGLRGQDALKGKGKDGKGKGQDMLTGGKGGKSGKDA